MIVFIVLLLIRMDVISGLRNDFKKEVTCQVKRRDSAGKSTNCGSLATKLSGLSRIEKCRKCSNYYDGRTGTNFFRQPCVYTEGGKGKGCTVFSHALDKRSLVTYIMSCPRTCDDWTQKEPTGCPTRCGMSAGLGKSGAVVCSTGGRPNDNCFEDHKPKPKQCPATPLCGKWIQGEPSGCATKCGVAAGKLGTPGAVTCDSPNGCDTEPGAKPAPRQCPKTVDCGNWKQGEPLGCLDRCGLAPGLSGTPGKVTCSTDSCDPAGKPIAKQCPGTPRCSMGECSKSDITLRVGEFLFTGDGLCLVLPCRNAVVGEHYVDSGSPSNSTDTKGDCITKKCDASLLENGQFFAPPQAVGNTTATCHDLIKQCNFERIPAGWKFNRSQTCTLTKCDPVLGKYFDGSGICSTKDCTNKPKAGFQYVENSWVNQHDECRIESCPDAPDFNGKFFVDRCNTKNCTNAPVGKYYLSNGGTENKCPYASCSNARPGQKYTPGFVTAEDPKCPTQNCPKFASPGFYFATAGSCDATKCNPTDEIGTYFTKGCEVGECINGKASTYYVPAFNTDPSKCATKDCGKPPPPGLLFAEKTGCEIKVCTNAPAGRYYTQVLEERTAYLKTMQCPVARCSPPKPDRRFVRGFATDRNACPTKPCDKSRLPKGYYFKLTKDYTECTPTPCESLPGYFYLHSAEGGRAGCSKVRAKCTNAKLGETYAAQTDVVSNKTECPVKPCDAPPAGKDFGTKGSCDRFVSCTTATAGQYYVKSSSAANRCQTAECTNAEAGDYYKAAVNNKDSQTCRVGKCTILQGYTFKTAGKCSGMQPCELPPAGFYFEDSNTQVCKHGKCTYRNRGHWKFIPGFVFRPDKCPYKKCPGEQPPDKYESDHSCAAATLAADIDTGSGEKFDTMTVVIVAAISGIVLLLLLVIIVFFTAKKGNTSVLTPSRRSSVTVASSNNGNDGYLDASQDQEFDTLGDGKAGSIATKFANEMAGSDLLLNAGDVTVGRKLAQGAGGQIFMGRFADQDVALKESYDMLMNDLNNELVREAAMMTKLRHHNIVRFFGIWPQDEDRVFLVMELCPKGDLRDAAQDPESTLKERQQWILQVASAMEYLHGRTPIVVHRDLKPQNVLLDAKRNAKVCDFGTSKTMETTRDMTVGIGTVAYMAPEMMRAFSDRETKIEVDGTKCDVFSFAMLALYVATGKTPYDGLNNNEIFVKIGVNGGRTAVPAGYSDIAMEQPNADEEEETTSYKSFVKFVKRMWQEKPEDRPDFNIVVMELEKIWKR